MRDKKYEVAYELQLVSRLMTSNDRAGVQYPPKRAIFAVAEFLVNDCDLHNLAGNWRKWPRPKQDRDRLET